MIGRGHERSIHIKGDKLEALCGVFVLPQLLDLELNHVLYAEVNRSVVVFLHIGSAAKHDGTFALGFVFTLALPCFSGVKVEEHSCIRFVTHDALYYAYLMHIY